MLGSSEPIKPAEGDSRHVLAEDSCPQVRLLCVIMLIHTLTCVSCAGRLVRGHAVPLQRWMCVRHGQQVVVTQSAPYARVRVQQPAGITAWDGHSHIVVRWRQSLLVDRDMRKAI